MPFTTPTPAPYPPLDALVPELLLSRFSVGLALDRPHATGGGGGGCLGLTHTETQ